MFSIAGHISNKDRDILSPFPLPCQKLKFDYKIQFISPTNKIFEQSIQANEGKLVILAAG